MPEFVPGKDETYIRGGLSNAAYDASQALGVPEPASRTIGRTTQNTLDFLPFIGAGAGAEEAIRDIRAGDYLPGIIGGVGTLAGAVIPGASKAGSALKSAVKSADVAPMSLSPKGIRAFHGSPHDFDKFSTANIGTGEGAQAYGHGLYFAENEGVAKNYRDSIAGNAQIAMDGEHVPWDQIPNSMEGRAMGRFRDHRGNAEDAIKELKSWNSPEAAEWLSENKDRLSIIENPGSMYEVNINANPEDFLDWDKPLSEQPESVRNMASSVTPPDELRMEGAREIYGTDNPWKVHAGDAAERVNDWARPRMTGQDLYWSKEINPSGTRQDAIAISDKLREAGIPGIKYLDQGSRGIDNATEGSRNFVVFDDKLINIVKKYGIAAAIGAGLLTQADADQMLAQGDLEG